MRAASLIPVLMIPALMFMNLPTPARSEALDTTPSAATQANEAEWADLDAQARMAEGDYDGAVQANQRAEAARKQADELAARTQANPPHTDTRPNGETAR